MAFLAETRPTLAGTLWPASSHPLVRAVVLVLAGTLFLTLSAKTKVPFWPVEMTMQTFAVMVIGAAYGWRLGAITVIAYLAEGAMGLPVFTGTPEKGLGLAYMMGPTGGYLVGFVFAAAIVGWAAERGASASPLKLGATMLAADVVLFAFGVLWLGTLLGWDKPILAWGVLPFIPGEALKIALAAVGIPALWALVKRR